MIPGKLNSFNPAQTEWSELPKEWQTLEAKFAVLDATSLFFQKQSIPPTLQKMQPTLQQLVSGITLAEAAQIADVYPEVRLKFTTGFQLRKKQRAIAGRVYHRPRSCRRGACGHIEI